jgi:hypothetical protein
MQKLTFFDSAHGVAPSGFADEANGGAAARKPAVAGLVLSKPCYLPQRVAAELVPVSLLAWAKGGEYDHGVGRKRREETELELRGSRSSLS